jgi:hypothetical protein
VIVAAGTAIVVELAGTTVSDTGVAVETAASSTISATLVDGLVDGIADLVVPEEAAGAEEALTFELEPPLLIQAKLISETLSALLKNPWLAALRLQSIST